MRKTLLNFIREGDSGRTIGSPSHLRAGRSDFCGTKRTDETILRKAVERIGFRNSVVRDNEPPAIVLYQALEIQNENARSDYALRRFDDER